MIRNREILARGHEEVERSHCPGLSISENGGSMTCEHTETFVVDSRRDIERKYPVIKFRRRQCVKCGMRIPTVEVPQSYMEETLDKVEKKKQELAKEIAEIINSQY